MHVNGEEVEKFRWSTDETPATVELIGNNAATLVNQHITIDAWGECDARSIEGETVKLEFRVSRQLIESDLESIPGMDDKIEAA